MILHDLMEASAGEVAIIFGRFNPPHKGHKAAWEMAAQSPIWYVGTNKSTQGPKDPLPFDVKIKAMSVIWPAVADHIVAEQSWLTLASKVYAQHGDVKLIILTDEDWVTKTINQYNGVESAHGFYKFSNIETKPTPRLSSATALRDAVIKGDRKSFSNAAGVSADTKIAGVPFFDMVAQYLLPYQEKKKKVKEGVEPDPAGYHHDLLTTPKYTLVIDTPSDLDWYKIGQHFPNLGTEDPHEYGQSDTDMTIATANRAELEKLKAKLDRLGLKYKEIGGTFDQPEIHAEGSGFDQEAGIGIDGKTFKFKVRDLVALASKYPVQSINTVQFKQQLADRDEAPEQALARAEKADLKYPIIVVKRTNGQLWIADGTHRVQKALMMKLPKINARIIPVDDMGQFSINETIRKVKGGYRLVSKHGSKNLGTYPTKAGAKKRERQVQYFKHMKESIADLNIQFHDELNPAIWKDGKMRPEVRSKLMRIAKDFQDSLGIKLTGLKDITVSGSNAAYSYTPKSDVDLHLVADIPEADDDKLYRELFDAKKYQYNTEHDYKIRGYDVELYVQNANQTHVSQGIYSVMRDEWVKEPQKITGGFDKDETLKKYENLRDLIQHAIKTRDFFLADKLRATIKKYRQAGLHATGEFGPENLAFKAIRANGYMDKLYQLLNDLKDQELSIPEYDQKLTEIDMSPGALKKFASTPVAQAMTVGFEAEMVVPGLAGGDPDDYDSEPDFDMDEYVDTSSIARLTRGLAGFFRDTATTTSVERAVGEVNDEIMDYMDQQFNDYISDNTDDVKAQYKNDTELSDEEIEASIQKQDKDYDDVIEAMRDDFYSSWDDLEGALESLGLQMYSDWDNRFGWGWPYFTEPDYSNADVDGSELAKDWTKVTGYPAKASTGYHSAERAPGTWIFEPDSSIQADSGMGGIEMVSPPMPLAQGMKALEEFFEWAGMIGAEANRSTGFHMGVSIPNQTYDNIDHLKLILLLGDQNVLARFNRSANQYTKSILEKIKNNLRKVDLDKAFDTMRKGMQLIASEAVGDEIIGRQDRYVSVNIKGEYIEFRSAGGDYFDKKDELRNVMLRYVRVMASAADPEADKQEYAKKLYKLLSTITGDETNTIKAFAAYTAGTITRSELVGMLKQAQVARIQKKAEPDQWYGVDRNSKPVTTVSAKNEQEALKLAFAWERNNPIFGGIRGVIRVSDYAAATAQSTEPEGETQLYGVYVQNDDGRNVEQTRVRARNRQEASAMAFRWGRDNNRVVTGIDVIESAQSINESKEIVTELANQPYPYKNVTTKHDANFTKYVFTSENGINYKVSLIVEYDDYSQPTNKVSVEFAAFKNTKYTQDVLNTGDAFRVFATVASIVKNYLRSHPEITRLEFSADNDEPSRIKLYSAMSKMMPKFLNGWKLSDVENGYKYHHYKFIKLREGTLSSLKEYIEESKSSMTGREMLHYYEQCHHAGIKNAKMRMYLMENDWQLGKCEAKDVPNAAEFKNDAFGRDMKLDMEQVARYMEAMHKGEEVMPIIMGPDKSIIDGNHRAQAARALNRVIECYRAK